MSPLGTIWRMESPCADCLFAKAGPGLKLRLSLRPGRMDEILASLQQEGFFLCHKTTGDEDDEEPAANLVCAGSLDYQNDHKLTLSPYVQVCQRLELRRREGKPP